MKQFDLLNDKTILERFNKIDSILITQDKSLIFENYYDSLGPVYLRNTRSATKTITGLLIGIAIDQGFIGSVQKPVIDYFIDLEPFANEDPRKSAITIQDLLTMSSILECDDFNSYSRGNEERMYLVENWIKFFFDLPIRGFPEWVTKPEDSKYGRSFRYCTAGVVVLGSILEKATGIKLENFAKEYLFDPMEITTFKWQYTPMNTPMTGGGLQLTAKDLLKLGELFLNKGVWNDKRIISQKWVEESIRAHADIDDETDYGYLWWIKNYSVNGITIPAYYMSGAGGNRVMIFPNQNSVIVITSSNFGIRNAHQLTNSLLEEYILPNLL